MPALQSLVTSRVDDDEQGQLQGVLASLMSLAGIAGRVLTTAVFFSTKNIWIGTIWLVGAALYLLASPLLATARNREPWRPRRAEGQTAFIPGQQSSAGMARNETVSIGTQGL